MAIRHKSFTTVSNDVNIPITDAVVDISDIRDKKLEIIGRVRKAIKLSNNPHCVSVFTTEAISGDVVEICKKYVKLETVNNE